MTCLAIVWKSERERNTSDGCRVDRRRKNFLYEGGNLMFLEGRKRRERKGEEKKGREENPRGGWGVARLLSRCPNRKPLERGQQQKNHTSGPFCIKA
jgi:hypothetical protein